LIVGSVDVREGAIIGDLAKQQPPPAGAISKRSPWRAEIDVNAPGNLRMSTAVASVELGEGEDLHVSFQDPTINVSGRIQVLGGRYRVFNNVFTISSGTIEFRDTGRLPEPILDVYAQTQVTIARSPEKPPNRCSSRSTSREPSRSWRSVLLRAGEGGVGDRRAAEPGQADRPHDRELRREGSLPSVPLHGGGEPD
jgi:hypothetical protein